MEALTKQVKARDEEVRQELSIFNVVVSTRVMATFDAPRVEVLKPQVFNDKRDAKELDNFLWQGSGTLRQLVYRMRQLR